MTTAYCTRCRTKREMANERTVTMKSGKSAADGTCPRCGQHLFRIHPPVLEDARAGLNYDGDLEQYRR